MVCGHDIQVDDPGHSNPLDERIEKNTVVRGRVGGRVDEFNNADVEGHQESDSNVNSHRRKRRRRAQKGVSETTAS